MTTIGRRIVGAIPVLLGISFIVFMLMHLAPGDPVVLLLGDDATPADVARVRHEWGLDQPLLAQYWQFISRALVGDFGKSLKFGEPVLKLVSERLPATIELATVSLLVAILISIPIGVYSAIKRDTLARPCRNGDRPHRRFFAELLARHHADLFSRRPMESAAGCGPD